MAGSLLRKWPNSHAAVEKRGELLNFGASDGKSLVSKRFGMYGWTNELEVTN